VFGYVTAY